MGQRSADGFGPAHVILRGDRVEGIELFSGQADRHDLHRLSPTTGTSTAPSLELFDVVALFGFIGPLLDLLFTHHS